MALAMRILPEVLALKVCRSHLYGIIQNSKELIADQGASKNLHLREIRSVSITLPI